MADKKQVFRWLEDHAEEMQQFLSSLIRIRSFSGEELDIQQKVMAEMKAAGLEVAARAYDEKGIRPNVLGTLKGTGGGEGLLMVAHSDTVPVPNPELWDHDPFSGYFDGTWIYGRGAGDDKWGITAAFFAIRALQECGVKLSGDVHLLSSVGEENGVNDYHLGAGPMVRDMEEKPSFGIICEASIMEICPETPRSMSIEILVPGKADHPSSRRKVVFPQPHNIRPGSLLGVDALQKAMPVIDAMYRLERDLSIEHNRGGLLGSGGMDRFDRQGVGAFTMTPTQIVGGNGGAIIGDVTLKYWIDFPSTYTHEEVFEIIQKTVDGIADGDLWLREHRPFVRQISRYDGFSIDPNHPGVGTMCKAFEDAMERPAVVSCWLAQCDGSVVAPYVPCVVFGPQPKGSHAPNDRITLQEMVDSAKVFVSMAMDHCK